MVIKFGVPSGNDMLVLILVMAVKEYADGGAEVVMVIAGVSIAAGDCTCEFGQVGVDNGCGVDCSDDVQFVVVTAG